MSNDGETAPHRLGFRKLTNTTFKVMT